MSTLGSLLYLFLAALLAALWIRGYLTAGLSKIADAVQHPPTIQPFTFGASAGGGGGSGHPLTL